MKVLHEAEPPDETRLVRQLCRIDGVVQFSVRQMLNDREPT